MERSPGDRGPYDVLGLLRRSLRVLRGPGNMLPNVCDLQEVTVDARLLKGLAEGTLVHPRGTRSHDHPVQPLFRDIVSDQLLPRLRAHEAVVPCHDHPG